MVTLAELASSLIETFRFSLLVIVVTLLVQYIIKQYRYRKNLPPGPRGLPVIGNMLQLGKNPHLAMTELSHKYGDVYRLQLGSRMVIVVNGMEAIKQALLRQPMDFVTRPEMHSASYVCQGHSIVFGCMPPDEQRRYRRLIVDALGTYAMKKVEDVKSDINNNGQNKKPNPVVESIVTEEVTDLSRRLIEISRHNFVEEEDTGELTKMPSSESQSTPTRRRKSKELTEQNRKEMCNTFHEIAWTTSNILSAFLFGERYSPGDSPIDFIIDNNNDFAKTTAACSAADMMPWVRYLVPSILNKFRAVTGKFEKFMTGVINKHLDRFDNVYDWERRHIRPVEPKNVLDSLIVTARKNRGNPLYTEEHTVNTIIDLMGAGFDTVSKSLMWMFVYASVFQDAQEKIQKEIDEFMEKNKTTPSYADRRAFHYTNAFMHEVLRHSSFVPFTIPHAVTRDNVKLMGYNMPRGTIVFINQWSVNHDESVWSSPDHFRPERFLASDGSFKSDIGDKVLIFGMGRRACPGKILAKLEMFLYITGILRECKLSMHPDHPGLPATEYGLTMRPETGKMIVKAR